MATRLLILVNYYLIRIFAQISWLLGFRNGPLRGIRRDYSSGDKPKNQILSEAYVLSDYGVVIDKNWNLVSSLSPTTWGNIIRHEALHKMQFQVNSILDGKTLLLSSHQHQNYFHWLIDVMPRYELVENYILSFKHIIVNNEIPFQKESIKILQIPEEAIISPCYGQLFKVNSLIAPELEAGIGGITKRKINYIRRKFLPANQLINHSKKLYITRSDARFRRVLNELELANLLNALDFEVVNLSKLSFSQQITLFKDSSIVVAPHGAGLTNVIFMDVNSTVIELMPDNYRNDCFQLLSFQCELKFKRIICSSKNSNLHDMSVDLKEFEKLIKNHLYFNGVA